MSLVITRHPRESSIWRLSEHVPTALAIVPNKREKKLKKLLDAHSVELWK